MCFYHPKYTGRLKPKRYCINCWIQWFGVTEYQESLSVEETNKLLYVLLQAEADRQDKNY